MIQSPPSPAPPGRRPPRDPEGPVDTFLRQLLAEQQAPGIAEIAAEAVARGDAGRHLIPLSRPRPGEQYAFDVDLDRCSGCKGCVTACHNLNGLDDDEVWRSVGLLVGPDPPAAATPLHLTVTTACHHCVEPACLRGCPVLAYDKDPITGIVRHLDDQCIGCSYCLMTCPYEVPRLSARRGIVRKCDMCHQRLEAGEAPACVQGCPNEAIRITNVRVDWVTIGFKSPAHPSGPPSEDTPLWWQDAPDPALTLPTTRYRSRHLAQGDGLAADTALAMPGAAHTPLVAMLLLTQAGIGFWMGAPTSAPGPALFLAGLLVAPLHLGRPAGAWRSFLGWRTSWLSREIVLFQLAALPAVACLVLALPAVRSRLPGVLPPAGLIGLAAAGVLAGLAGVWASVQVYAVTRRPWWAAIRTAPRFLGTTAGATLIGLCASGTLPVEPTAAAAVALAWLRRLPDARLITRGSPLRALERSRSLLRGELGRLFRGWTWILSVSTGLWLAVALHTGTGALAIATLAWALSEVIERHIFFRAASPDRMPGNPTGPTRTGS